MGIPTLVRWYLYIELAPWCLFPSLLFWPYSNFSNKEPFGSLKFCCCAVPEYNVIFNCNKSQVYIIELSTCNVSATDHGPFTTEVLIVICLTIQKFLHWFHNCFINCDFILCQFHSAPQIKFLLSITGRIHTAFHFSGNATKINIYTTSNVFQLTFTCIVSMKACFF